MKQKLKILYLHKDDIIEKVANDYYQLNKAKIQAKNRKYYNANKATLKRKKKIYKRQVEFGARRKRKRLQIGNSYVFIRQ